MRNSTFLKETIRLSFMLYICMCSLQISAQQVKWPMQYEGYVLVNGESSPFEMRLQGSDNELIGTYYYYAVGVDMKLKGSLKGDSLKLTEYTSEGKEIATFSGTYFRNNNSATGHWIRKKDGKSFPFGIVFMPGTSYKMITRKKEREYIQGPFTYNGKSIYPEMAGFSDDKIQKDFNYMIVQNTVDLTDEYLKNMFRYLKPEDYPDGQQYSDDQAIWVNLKTDYFISLGLANSSLVGGAGAKNEQKYWLYDVTDNTILSLDDVLRNDTASFQILQGWVNEAVKKRGDWNIWKDEYLVMILTPEATLMNEFYLTKQGFSFYFPHPAAITNIIGIRDVVIPFEQMMPILEKKTVLYQWLKEVK